MLNNPLRYSDPSGEFAWIPVIIGAVIGGYSGYKIGKANGATGWKMFGYIAGGAIVGGVSGGLSYTVATSGMAFANTTAIMTGSFTYSFGMSLVTGGKIPFIISFGVASFNFDTGKWGYLGKSGNKWYENLGYFLGAMANIKDLNDIINQTEAVLYTQKNDLLSHSSIVEKKSGKILMSFGPDDDKGGSLFKYSVGFRKSTSYYHVYKDLPLNLKVNKYVFSLTRTIGKYLPFQGISTNCVNMSSLSLWLNGIPNLGIHSYLLYATTWAYTNGIRADLFSYYLVNR